MENTPHGLSASALTTTSASTAMMMIMMTKTPISAGDAAEPAQLVAGHLTEAAAAARVEIHSTR